MAAILADIVDFTKIEKIDFFFAEHSKCHIIKHFIAHQSRVKIFLGIYAQVLKTVGGDDNSPRTKSRKTLWGGGGGRVGLY